MISLVVRVNSVFTLRLQAGQKVSCTVLSSRAVLNLELVFREEVDAPCQPPVNVFLLKGILQCLVVGDQREPLCRKQLNSELFQPEDHSQGLALTGVIFPLG